MIKKKLFTMLGISLFAGAAAAADLPSRTVAPAAPFIAPVPAFAWTGFYVGVNAGGAFGSDRDPAFVADGAFPTSNSNLYPAHGRSSGFTGGGELGYNWQFGGFVAGLEADINYLDRGAGVDGTYATNPIGYGAQYPTYTLSGFGHDAWFGTVRGRLGYAVDRALLYVTGGLAYGGGLHTGTVTVNGVPGSPNVPFTSNGNDDTRVGWTLGGGVEYALTNNWSIKGEYLFVDLGDRTTLYTGGGGGVLQYRLRTSASENVARAGVNYKF